MPCLLSDKVLFVGVVGVFCSLVLLAACVMRPILFAIVQQQVYYYFVLYHSLCVSVCLYVCVVCTLVLCCHLSLAVDEAGCVACIDLLCDLCVTSWGCTCVTAPVHKV